MNNNRDSDFFSTEEEYNKKRVAQDNGEIEETDYTKYFDDKDDMTDIFSGSSEENGADGSFAYSDAEEDEEYEEDEDDGRDRKKGKKIVIALVCVILAILIAAGGAVAYFFHISEPGEFNDDGIDYNNEADIVDDGIVDENLDFEAMGSVTDAASLNEYLYNWANNKGEKMYSKNVINVLLCGVDTTGGAGRSDSMILVSVNKKSKTVTLSSFFRDSYTYMDIPLQGGGYKGRYEKLNASYSLGGPATLIDTLEKNFKIEIDQYIMVNFASFKGIIDAVGGITVDVEEREASYIRRTSSHKNFPSGKGVHLNGKEALVYSRIRYLDSDINRTERQRKVIKSLIDSAKGATKGQLVNAYKKVAKYLRTGYSQSEVLSLLGAAVAQDWMSYEINEITLPAEDGVEMMSAMIYTTSSPSALQWVWIVDYPLCAQKLQLAIYGESNVKLEDGRDTALSFMRANNVNSGGSSGSYSGNSGYNYTTTSSYTQPTVTSPYVPETPTAPGGETPVTPGGETPVTPGGETPTTPGGETPATPGGETPATPGGDTPVTPGGETPAAPVAPDSAPAEEV